METMKYIEGGAGGEGREEEQEQVGREEGQKDTAYGCIDYADASDTESM